MNGKAGNLSAIKKLSAVLVFATAASAICAQDTAFIYQGRLLQSGNAPTGLFDFTFTMFNSASLGN